MLCEHLVGEIRPAIATVDFREDDASRGSLGREDRHGVLEAPELHESLGVAELEGLVAGEGALGGLQELDGGLRLPVLEERRGDLEVQVREVLVRQRTSAEKIRRLRCRLYSIQLMRPLSSFSEDEPEKIQRKIQVAESR